MMKAEHFERELSLIKSPLLRDQVREYLNEHTPAYFWKIGASSSGKYHPIFSQGNGGLVRHTKAVVMFAEELLKMSSYAYMREDYKDYVIAACIIHDTCKYGRENEMDKGEYAQHAPNAAQHFAEFCESFYPHPVSELLLGAVRSHMGQWSTDKEDRPFTQIDRCVHMADYMASRSFIDIPNLVQEYEMVELDGLGDDLPFVFGGEEE